MKRNKDRMGMARFITKVDPETQPIMIFNAIKNPKKLSTKESTSKIH